MNNLFFLLISWDVTVLTSLPFVIWIIEAGTCHPAVSPTGSSASYWIISVYLYIRTFDSCSEVRVNSSLLYRGFCRIVDFFFFFFFGSNIDIINSTLWTDYFQILSSTLTVLHFQLFIENNTLRVLLFRLPPALKPSPHQSNILRYHLNPSV